MDSTNVRRIFDLFVENINLYGFNLDIFYVCSYGIYSLVYKCRHILEEEGIGTKQMFDILKYNILKRHFSEDLDMFFVLKIMELYGSNTPVDVFEMVLLFLFKHHYYINKNTISCTTKIAKSSLEHTTALFKIFGLDFCNLG